jgi:serine/threonine protein kinase
MKSPDQIGRFEVQEVLGKGSQGIVHLARDPRLDRNVAIKTIRVSASDLKKQQARLMREAKLVSRLQHPNVIPLYEAGEDKGLLYLVFEYVDGVSLKERIRAEGPLIVRQAIDLTMQILSGIQHAHEQGIVHRDLSPSNLLIDRNGLPRIMDFGISVIAGVEESILKDVAGTPCYMSPEHFSNDPVTFQSDIFSLGLIFYEMVLGHPAVQADNYVAVMYKIASESLPPPSQENRDIDKKLDEVFLRAVEKKPDVRYFSASKMREDLETYLVESGQGETEEGAGGAGHSTLDFLLRRIRHKGDFPSFSHNIMEINKKASASRANMASASELSNAILKDYSLTNKLLRLVNSAFYGQFAGTVTTVSRAVVILGFEQVRMAASALLLFEHMARSSHTDGLKDEALQSFVSGMLAKDMADRSGFEGMEEAFICSMVHQLGRRLVLCYFPEEHGQIHSLMASKGVSASVAVRNVLGISYDDLGMGVARTWRFPEKIVQSMRSLPAGKPDRPGNDLEMLRNLSSFSNELIEAACGDGGGGGGKLEDVLARFENTFPMNEKQLRALLNKTRERVEQFADVLDVNLEQSRLMRRMKERGDDPGASVAGDARAASEAKGGAARSFMDTAELEVPTAYSGREGAEDHQGVLINGIQDITNTILGDFDLNDLLTMVMETMYRGLTLQSVFLCVREGNRSIMSARLGFGKEIEEVSTRFRFPIESNARDVFGLAVTHGKDIHISNAGDPRIRKRIPDWYRRFIGDPAFALFPVVVEKRPFALFFLGRDRTGDIFDEKCLNYLRTLRNQAVLAVRQSR